MRKSFVFESFEGFVNYQKLMEAEPTKPAQSQTLPWDFKFDSGKFKKSEVTQDQLQKLDADFKKKIVPLFNNQNYTGQKLEISISAASSKVPINPSGEVARELKAAGYASDNAGLCKARGNTVASIIKDLVYENFGAGMDRKEFDKALEKKMMLVNNPLPNIGPDYNKSAGDNPDDQKYKDNQFISATLKVLGEKIPIERFISCNMDKQFSGGQANAENGFAGYDKTVFLKAKAGQKLEIYFDPITVPDAILFSYSGKEAKLSPFSGTYGAIFVAGLYDKAREDARNKAAAEGKSATARKQNIGGKDYLVIDYKEYINNVVNKGGVLVAAIEKRLKSLGLKPIKELCPEFFDSEGKIEVYRNKDLSSIRIAPDDVSGGALTYELIKSGKMKESPKAYTASLKIEITKNAVRDAVTLVAFSPIAGTAFRIQTKCS